MPGERFTQRAETAQMRDTWQIHLGRAASQLCEQVDRLLDSRTHFRIDAIEVADRQTQAHARDRLRHLREIVFFLVTHARDVELIVTRHHAEHQRRILDGARHRTAVIQREGQRHDALDRHQAVGWLESHDAAERCRHTYRSARVGTERAIAQRTRDGCAGA